MSRRSALFKYLKRRRSMYPRFVCRWTISRAVLSRNPLRCEHRRAKRITCDRMQPYLHRFMRMDVMCGYLTGILVFSVASYRFTSRFTFLAFLRFYTIKPEARSKYEGGVMQGNYVHKLTASYATHEGQRTARSQHLDCYR